MEGGRMERGGQKKEGREDGKGGGGGGQKRDRHQPNELKDLV